MLPGQWSMTCKAFYEQTLSLWNETKIKVNPQIKSSSLVKVSPLTKEIITQKEKDGN